MKDKGKVIQTIHFEKGTFFAEKQKLIDIINHYQSEIEIKYQSATDKGNQIINITITFKSESER